MTRTSTVKTLPNSFKKPCAHNWTIYFTGDGYHLEKCLLCDLIRVVSEKKTLAEYASDDIEEAVKQYWMRGDDWRSFSKKFVDYLPSEKGRLLDIGSGLGWVVAEANKRGFNAWGLDPSKSKVALGKKRVEKHLLAGTIEEYKPTKKFDYITMNHVFEHIPDLTTFLQHVRRLLVKRGWLLIACPNINSLTFRIFRKRWYPMSPREHYWQFTPKTLAQIVRNEGFSVRKIIVNSMSYNPPNPLKKLAFFFLLSFANLVGLGDQIVILAKKHG